MRPFLLFSVVIPSSPCSVWWVSVISFSSFTDYSAYSLLFLGIACLRSLLGVMQCELPLPILTKKVVFVPVYPSVPVIRVALTSPLAPTIY